MEKVFQVSFVYFAGIAAFFALSKSEVMTSIVRATGLPLGGLVAVVILLLNLVYVTLACACLFAILKRGLFILTHTSNPKTPAEQMSLHREWEVFVRDDSSMGPGRMRNIAWNIDNYYMVPLLSVIVVASVTAAIMAAMSDSFIIRIVAAALIMLHAIPIFILRQLSVLDRQCRKLLKPKL